MQTDHIPLGYCQCGCGLKTDLASTTRPCRGYVKGQPLKYRLGHSGDRIKVRWLSEDRGYETPCWIWQLALDRLGYAEVRHQNRNTKGHIVNYVEAHGPVPDGLELDHLCRQRECVNPAHLELVTHTENMRRAANTKLTMELAREIRASSESGPVIGARLGVSRSTISFVRRGKYWRESE